MHRFIYADNSATTALSKTALDAMMPYLTTEFGNASSLYAFGGTAKQAIEDARGTVAELLGAKPREIYFTAGGIGQLGYKGLCQNNEGKGQNTYNFDKVRASCSSSHLEGFRKGRL